MSSKAFTLAEVLITLGITGIVASLTLPLLISSHNKSVTETRLSKEYNVFSNAIKLSEIDNGVMSDWPTGSNLNMDEFWNIYMKPYFIGAKLCLNYTDCGYPKNLDNRKWAGGGTDWSIHSDDSRILFQLNDGTVIFFPRNTSDSQGMPLYVSSLYIDINGSKKPNQAGRDVFYFKRNYQNGIITAPKGECTNSTDYCTYEIMSNGWKIPDDYPFKF